MESDSTGDYEKQKEHRDIASLDRDVPEPIWVRRTNSFNYEVNWMGLLDYNVFVLCVGSIILLGFFLFS